MTLAEEKKTIAELVVSTEDEGHSIENTAPVLCTLFVYDE